MFTRRQSLVATALISTLLFACGSSEPDTGTAGSTTTTEAESTTTSLQTTSTDASTTSTEGPDSEVDMPDLDTGYQLGEVGGDRELWAVPDSESSGCEGEPAWRIWSVSKVGDDPFPASETFFFSEPGGQFIGEGVVLSSVCEEQSWQVRYAELGPDGSLVEEVDVVATGQEDLLIQDVLIDQRRGRVVFLLDNGSSTQLTAVDPPTSEVIDDFVLGGPDQGCSAEGVDPAPVGDDQLTDEARATGLALLDAAVACDFAELERIGADDLNYSFGADQRGAARYWALGEYFGESYLRNLVEVLELEPTLGDIGDESQAYGWPAISILPLTALDENARTQLEDLGYTDEQIDEAMTTGSFYGYRTAVDTDGRWLYFVAGD